MGDNTKRLNGLEGDNTKRLNGLDRRGFIRNGVVATAIGATLAGCSDADDNQEGNGDDPDTGGEKTSLVISSPAEQTSLDGTNANLTYNWEWTYLVYNAPLKFEYDWDSEEITTVPDLATDYERIEEDGESIIQFTFRDDVEFHNGDSLDAELVKAEYDYAMENETTVWGQVLDNLLVEQVSVDDDRTVNLHVEDHVGQNFFDWLMPRAMIVNPYAREEIGAENFAVDPQGGGTGPYRYTDFESGSYVRMERYENYHEEGVPNFEEAECRILPEGSTRMAQLRTGDLDLDSFVSAVNYNSLQDDENVVTTRDETSTINIAVVSNHEHEDLEPFQDARVRRALAQAIDRDGFNNAVFEGYANKISLPTIVDTWWHFPELEERNFFDLENARQLLQEAGYGDGFEVPMMVGSDPWHEQMGQIIQNMWGEVGVEVALEPIEPTTMWTRIFQGEHSLALSEHLGPKDPIWFMDLYHVSDDYEPGGITTGATGWFNEEYAQSVQEAYTAEPERRQELYRRACEIFAEEMPAIWFSQAQNLAVHSSGLEDYWHYPEQYSRETLRYLEWNG